MLIIEMYYNHIDINTGNLKESAIERILHIVGRYNLHYETHNDFIYVYGESEDLYKMFYDLSYGFYMFIK